MNKYINAEKLIAELRRQKHELELSIQSQGDYGQSCQIVAYENILSLIGSLQQEQPEVCEPEYGPYARQYPKSKVSQEQPEVELEKELKNKKATLLDDAFGPMNGEQSLAIRNFARYFYKLGKIARKEE